MKGIGTSTGIAIGNIFVKHNKLEVKKYKIEDCDEEIRRLRRSLDTSISQVKELIVFTEDTLGKEEGKVFEAHIHMLRDEEFITLIENKIREFKFNVEWAVKEATDFYVDMFNSLNNSYMRERSSDLIDVSSRIINNLLNLGTMDYSKLNEAFILIAHDLTPSETAQLPKDKVLGFITEAGGPTSHVAIMAKNLGIPAIVGAGKILDLFDEKSLVAMDGSTGEFIINPDSSIINQFNMKKDYLEKEKELNKNVIGMKSVSKDDKIFEIVCNIGSSEELQQVIDNDGEGIGLFRSEFIYMGRNEPPSEEEQLNCYKEVVQGVNGKPVIIRTLDVGGDKELSYLNIKKEQNPFLGFRATRYCLKERELFKVQLRAILRSSAFGNVKIMFPMISSIQEVREVKELLEECKVELKLKQIPYDKDIQIGIMIEIPSAAIISDVLAKEVDFFSIGTNDLIQYTIAVDRLNESVSKLYTPYHPSILRLINTVIENGHKEGIPVGICGEAASDIKLLPIFMGMGLDEFSVSPSLVLKLRRYMKKISTIEAKELSDKVLKLGDFETINKLLEDTLDYYQQTEK
ncbi:MAG: phosphoenolpyruvate--protein phosphotransferase [Clostridium argentinense]|uniref:Phosphoenolpyruvate-protein phosphotransferase n=1 Tax=Clostridium faecium TaxID=2762223 RepID=A0ABR8YPC1_9CLOT|nr:phosphoenolpyruvate--protein phosphotransferase [Clostridium faecium]MBD8046090.1 phosphoenolpyruvate--protein phosphotransferase [Clostridium faecium]MBS5825501.1 phosphoenolpyruvate--protein phosphotransferase [Clostridium argentinense]MDU1350828.1 phosphoenolpyruvate--protein phosphotransferase [Clostridium argentinense]